MPHVKLRHIQIRLLLILITLIYSIFLLYLYSGTLDGFAPKHIGVSYRLFLGLPLTGYPLYLFKLAPAYYTFIEPLLSIAGINGYILPITPIMFFPYFLAFFVFISSLIRHANTTEKDIHLFTLLLLTFIYLSQYLIGSHLIFLWIHGVGEILFFMLLFLLYRFLEKSNNAKFLLVIVLVITTLTLTSYDVAFWSITFIFGILITGIILKGVNFIDTSYKFSQVLLMFIISVVIWMVYQVYVSSAITFHSVISLLSISMFIETISKFTIQFFGKGQVPLEFSRLLLKYPPILTHIYIAKYFIYVLFIFIGFRSLIIMIKTKYVKPIVIIYYFSTWIFACGYAILRISIGYFAITMIFYVALISILLALNINFSKKIRVYVTLLLTIWLILNFSAILIAQSYQVVHKWDYTYAIPSGKWAVTNIPLQSQIRIPDQMTFAWWFIEYNHYGIYSDSTINYLTHKDIINLYDGQVLSKNIYIPINYQENYIFPDGEAWYDLLPFKRYRNIIELNLSIKQKIYSADEYLTIIHT